MQRQRDGELVPIGEVVADLDGPVKAIREASPQARHHFTRFDQVNQLVGASEATVKPPSRQARHFMQLVGASGVNFELREEA